MTTTGVGLAKRTFTPKTLFRDFVAVVRGMPALRRATRAGRVSRRFSEEIMLVVTAVNDCPYCSYAHSRMALRAGVSPEEMGDLMALDLERFPEEERVALAFAQHYAESAALPDREALDSLTAYYGREMSTDILATIRMITFANLFGNTVDAVLSRLRGSLT